MKNGLSVAELRQTIDYQHRNQNDIVVPTRSIKMQTVLDGEDRTTVALALPGGGHAQLYPVAHEQLATQTGIPRNYYSHLLNTHPDLLTLNVNTALAESPFDHTRQVRLLDNNVRAILSPTYMPLDNQGLLNWIMPMFYEGMDKRTLATGEIIPALRDSAGNFLQAKIRSCNVTDRFATIKITVPAFGGNIRRGQTACIGFVIENSEVGLAKLRVSFFIEILECLNGMVRTVNFGGYSRRHIGGRKAVTFLGDGSRNVLSEAEQVRVQRLMFLEMGQTIRDTMTDLAIGKLLEPMQAAAQYRIEGHIDAAMSHVGRLFGITEAEQRGALAHFHNATATGDGTVDNTIWGIQAALTRYAADVPSYDRATELERAAGKIIDLKPSEWRQIATAERKEKDTKDEADVLSAFALAATGAAR